MLSPIICHLGPLQVRWYGVFAALAVLAGYFLAARRAPKFGLNRNDAADLLIVCVVVGIVGARLEYVRRFWDLYFADDWLRIFRVWEGGLVFQGGFLLALPAFWLFCRIRHWRPGDVGDLMALVVPVGHAIARIGCLLNGCCFGRPWAGPFAITYPAVGNEVLFYQVEKGLVPPDAVAPLPVIPVQALEAFVCLAIGGFIWFLEKKQILRYQRFTLYMLLYAVGRFCIEFLRGDYPRGGGLTPAQMTCVAVVLPLTAAVILWSVWRRRREASSSQAAPAVPNANDTHERRRNKRKQH